MSQSEVNRSYAIIDRRAIVASRRCTIDGKPAKISGVYNSVATVWPLGDPSNGVQFAWTTVARIMAAGGRFQS